MTRDCVYLSEIPVKNEGWKLYCKKRYNRFIDADNICYKCHMRKSSVKQK